MNVQTYQLTRPALNARRQTIHQITLCQTCASKRMAPARCGKVPHDLGEASSPFDGQCEEWHHDSYVGGTL